MHAAEDILWLKCDIQTAIQAFMCRMWG